MDTFYGQPKFLLSALDANAVGYELLIRRHHNGQWLLPEDFTKLPSEQFEVLLQQALQVMPATITAVSFNLERVHFVDPQYLAMVSHVQASTPIQLTVELTERHDPTIDNTRIIEAAKAFFAAGISVCIDDVGSGNNLPGLVEAMTPYVTSYKFGLQNLRMFNDDADLRDRLAFWAKRAETSHKRFDVAGVESLDDIAYLQDLHACTYVQGYYFGQPVPLQTENL
ncbi:EAL domain-containing protein [Lacticaseibacillus jixiensis]|uniref:EAL domain-containing protein n=1 Tax=Lacticaseibacillus jixiensis TaxID=3231926 RepID=UPI0036F21AE2